MENSNQLTFVGQLSSCSCRRSKVRKDLFDNNTFNFFYEDNISDSLLARYGWSRNDVDNFLIEMKGPSSRGATPVNVPLDESGEGGGVELIESDGNTVTIMDLLGHFIEEN